MTSVSAIPLMAKISDTDEDFIGLERGSRHRNHEADTGGGGIEFADHDADQRATDGQVEGR